jgi:4,5-DOPA dioxygenase extradiol
MAGHPTISTGLWTSFSMHVGEAPIVDPNRTARPVLVGLLATVGRFTVSRPALISRQQEGPAMSTMPTLFVSHGGPNVVLDEFEAHFFLKGLQSFIPRPSAIVINSAHFEAQGPGVVHDPNPEMIYDFGGFDDALHQMVYAAPGHPQLAETVTGLLKEAGHTPKPVAHRGFDHGVWNPLILAFPQADIPVVQVSVDPQSDAAWHVSVGEALAPLRHENVLVLGSGHITHNLKEIFKVMRGGEPDETLPGKVAAFTEWFHDKITIGDVATAENWLTQAPFPRDNHPTDEHLLPIFTAFGAAGEGAKGERIHDSTQLNGAFAWDAYRFS